MKIGIDARPLLSSTGTHRVLWNTLRELATIDQLNTYYLYSNKDFSLPISNSRWQKRIQARWPFLPGTLWLQTEAKKMIRRDGLDVFWGAEQALPLGLPPAPRRVLTILDLVWRRYPETMSYYNQTLFRLFAERWIQEAGLLMAISESTARDLEELLRVPKSKIRVVHLGVGPGYEAHDPVAAARFISGKYRTSENYLCAVGTIEPRKNLISLIRAFDILRQRDRFKSQLLVAGAKGWKDSEFYRMVSKLGLGEKEIKFLGYVPEEDMPFLYSGASVFVFPSLYEGFGLPLVEAMACGAPVVASNVSSIPEVVGDAALLVSPREPEEFADAILQAGSNSQLRAVMIQKGLERARRFSWKETARKTLRVFEELAAMRPEESKLS